MHARNLGLSHSMSVRAKSSVQGLISSSPSVMRPNRAPTLLITLSNRIAVGFLCPPHQRQQKHGKCADVSSKTAVMFHWKLFLGANQVTLRIKPIGSYCVNRRTLLGVSPAQFGCRCRVRRSSAGSSLPTSQCFDASHVDFPLECAARARHCVVVVL